MKNKNTKTFFISFNKSQSNSTSSPAPAVLHSHAAEQKCDDMKDVYIYKEESRLQLFETFISFIFKLILYKRPVGPYLCDIVAQFDEHCHTFKLIDRI